MTKSRKPIQFNQDDIEAVKAANPILQTVQSYGIDLKKKGREYFGLSPFQNEQTPSFSVDPVKGVFHCFSSNQGGDVIKFVQLIENVDFHMALNKLQESAGFSSSEVRKLAVKKHNEHKEEQARKERHRKQSNRGLAKEIWDKALDKHLNILENYLKSRCIDLEAIQSVYGYRVPPSLRLATIPSPKDEGAAQAYYVAMVGELVDSSGTFGGIHRTYLQNDGHNKADLQNSKRILGNAWGCLGRLSDPCELAVLGEGYETTLTVMAALARRGQKVFAASAVSLGNMAGAGLGQGEKHPVNKARRLPDIRPDSSRPGVILPSCVKHVILLQDADGKDLLSTECFMRRAVGKFRRQGIGVTVAVPALGKDFNDMVRVAA